MKRFLLKIAEISIAMLLLAALILVTIPFATAFGVYLLASGMLFVTMLPIKLLIAALEG